MSTAGAVLVADDEPAVRTLAARIIRAAGFQVLEAGDGMDALEQLTAAGPLVRLVLTDIRMPRMRGDQLAQRLASERPELRVLFMSGYAPTAHDLLIEAERHGRWIRKPFAPEELLASVRRALDAPSHAVGA